MSETLTPVLVVGGLLALLLELIPGFRTWWTAQEPNRKQVINLVLVFIVTLLFVVLPVLVAGQAWPTGWDWLLQPLTIFFVALAGNQTAHSGTRLLTRVRG